MTVAVKEKTFINGLFRQLNYKLEILPFDLKNVICNYDIFKNSLNHIFPHKKATDLAAKRNSLMLTKGIRFMSIKSWSMDGSSSP